MRKQDGWFGRGIEWGSNERGILVEGDIMRLGRNLVLVKFPEIDKDDTIVPAIVEKLPVLAYSCNHIGDYPNYHHSTFIQ